jgi:hypothetical protein
VDFTSAEISRMSLGDVGVSRYAWHGEIDYLGASTLQGRSPRVTEGGGVVSGGVSFHETEVSTPAYICCF